MSISSPLASLCSVLQTVRTSAENNAPLLRKNEAATRAALVDPVLRALGWDTANVQMVEPEKTVNTAWRADYALHDAEGNIVLLIEAKCLESNLEKYSVVNQLLSYAFGFGTTQILLTDGLDWHFYREFKPGSTPEAAASFSLRHDDLVACSLQLIQWLDAAQSGHGVSVKKSSAFEVSEEARVSSATFAGPAVKPKKPIAAEQNSFVELTHVNMLQLQPDQKPKQLRLPDGSVVPLKTWKDVLEKSCEFVLQHNQAIQLPYPDKAGKKRFLLTLAKPEVGASTLSSYMNKPIFIYTHYSATDCIANALHALKLTPPVLQHTASAVAF